ncbi:MAG: phosphatase PAP2 family protein, partial [Patescibacteria group bacterium]
MNFDTTLFETIHGIAGRFSALDFAGVFFARAFPLLLVAVFLVFLIIEPNWKVRFRKFALAAIAVILSRWIIGETIQFFYHRPRPSVSMNFEPLISPPQSPSFPSGHAEIFFALATAVFLVNRKWG